MNKYLLTIIFVLILTLCMTLFKNQSNFSEYIMIPLIVSLITKYIIGDWDHGYTYSYLDILYWITIFMVSIFTLYVFKHVFC